VDDPNNPPVADIPAFSAALGINENNGATNSDGLAVSAFTIELDSDNNQVGPDLGESFTDTLTLTVNSDVPEPSLFLPLAVVGIALAAVRLKRRKAACG